ncbi:MAG: hypothetical protein H6765_03720 [Candidatus Peribacteria bacterium]|nr:MAG: hypothetical protein H6765_03720 [Candidatus Peribacteria bacterium]
MNTYIPESAWLALAVYQDVEEEDLHFPESVRHSTNLYDPCWEVIEVIVGKATYVVPREFVGLRSKKRDGIMRDFITLPIPESNDVLAGIVELDSGLLCMYEYPRKGNKIARLNLK